MGTLKNKKGYYKPKEINVIKLKEYLDGKHDKLGENIRNDKLR
jgi:hypothetical protein